MLMKMLPFSLSYVSYTYMYRGGATVGAYRKAIDGCTQYLEFYTHMYLRGRIN